MSTKIELAADPLTKIEAEELTAEIRQRVGEVWTLITEAYFRRAWTALGYESWDGYCGSEFGSSRIRLPREERTDVVASLRDSGLSIRAISAATGDSYGTIQAEVIKSDHLPTAPGGVTDSTPGQTDRVQAALAKATADQDSPAHAQVSPEPTITGVDGKKYKKNGTKKKPDPQPVIVVENSTVAHQDEPKKLRTWCGGRGHEFDGWGAVYAALHDNVSALGTMIATLTQPAYRVGRTVKIPLDEAESICGEAKDLHAALMALLDNRPTGGEILAQSDELDRRAVEIVKDLFNDLATTAEQIGEEPDDGDTHTLWAPDVTVTVTSRIDYEDLRPWTLSIYRRAIEVEAEQKAEWLEQRGVKKYDTEPMEYLRSWTCGSTDEPTLDVFGATYLRLNPLILIGEMATWIAQEFNVDSIAVAEKLLDAYKMWDWRITESIKNTAAAGGDLGE